MIAGSPIAAITPLATSVNVAPKEAPLATRACGGTRARCGRGSASLAASASPEPASAVRERLREPFEPEDLSGGVQLAERTPELGKRSQTSGV